MGTPEAARSLKETMVLRLLFMAVLFAMAWRAATRSRPRWSGGLPRRIGLSYIRFYLSWAPHRPRAGRTGRYESTARVQEPLGFHVMSMGMETHIVRHLYPNTIPNHRTRPAYHALQPILDARGVVITQAVTEEIALRQLFRWMPLLFGLGFIAPLVAQIMAAWDVAAPLGMSALRVWPAGRRPPWGLYAVLRGRVEFRAGRVLLLYSLDPCPHLRHPAKAGAQ